MPERRRTRAKTTSQKDQLAYKILGAVGGVTVALIAIAVLFAGQKRDIASGCLANHRVPEAHTIILIDQTDPLSRQEIAYARDLIQTEYNWLPMNGLMTVRNIVDSPDSEEVQFCRVQTSEDVLGLAVNKRTVDQAYKKSAGAKLGRLLKGLAIAAPQEHSPIIEAVADVFQRPDFAANVKTRRLIVLSDMVQNSALYSQYGHGKRTPAMGEAARSALTRDMNGVQIRVHYVERLKLMGLQGAAHKAFWTRWFAQQGANVLVGHQLSMGEDPDKPVYFAPAGDN